MRRRQPDSLYSLCCQTSGRLVSQSLQQHCSRHIQQFVYYSHLWSEMDRRHRADRFVASLWKSYSSVASLVANACVQSLLESSMAYFHTRLKNRSVFISCSPSFFEITLRLLFRRFDKLTIDGSVICFINSASGLPEVARLLTATESVHLFEITDRQRMVCTLRCFESIRHLKTSWITDDLAEALSMNCRHLTVLDARCDPEMRLTDRGLRSLTENCHQLRQIVLNSFADEWEYEQKYRISGEAVLYTLLQLPELLELQLPPYLLQRALCLLPEYPRQLLSLRTLDLRCHYVTDQLLERLCVCLPQLHNLRINERFLRLQLRAGSSWRRLEVSDVGTAETASLARLLRRAAASLTVLRLSYIDQLEPCVLDAVAALPELRQLTLEPVAPCRVTRISCFPPRLRSLTIRGGFVPHSLISDVCQLTPQLTDLCLVLTHHQQEPFTQLRHLLAPAAARGALQHIASIRVTTPPYSVAWQDVEWMLENMPQLSELRVEAPDELIPEADRIRSTLNDCNVDLQFLIE